MLTIRPEKAEDHAAIRQVNTLAFGQANEADLVDALRRHVALSISLVAVQDGHIVGQIAFSPVTLTSETEIIEALGLAPMAVLPEFQRQGMKRHGVYSLAFFFLTCTTTSVWYRQPENTPATKPTLTAQC